LQPLLDDPSVEEIFMGRMIIAAAAFLLVPLTAACGRGGNQSDAADSPRSTTTPSNNSADSSAVPVSSLAASSTAVASVLKLPERPTAACKNPDGIELTQVVRFVRGQPQDLTGASGYRLRLTVTGVEDPVDYYKRTVQRPGDHVVAVHVTIRNVGGVSTTDSSLLGADLTDQDWFCVPT
jgi:hypothetical protein